MTAAAEIKDTSDITVLILDDEPSLGRLLARYLEEAGYVCQTATSAAIARELLSLRRFDLALCDLDMLGESGLDLIRHIKTKYPETGRVMVTSSNDSDTTKEILDIGVYGYILKPFNRSTLLITVQNSLQHLQEILIAGVRSANITRQLLAFARKQTIIPQVLDLNETVESMLKMLRRLIGEDIHLRWQTASIWPVKIDPSQVDQLLANICVNARDAISGVGKIIIETATAILNEAYCSKHTGFTPGEFVLLSISDNGCGMEKEVLDKLFEPFFTTKEMGKGTGLGLATVYGIVKQNNGFVQVYSEPGRGTIFKIYLPRHYEEGVQVEEQQEKAIKPGLGETVLVVEDEASILKLTARMLKNLGYTVLTANTPAMAIQLASEHTAVIHLLITDVVMPEMNGRDLSEELLTIHPGLKRLFMSGYTASAIASQGVLEAGLNFIQKPFSVRDLATKVHDILAEEL